MKWVFLIVLPLFFVTPVSAQEFNVGIVQGLWFSTSEVFHETPVRIYVAIRNNSGSDLTGTVEFFDNEKRIERNTVSALNGRIIESWADWEPTHGTHTISAILSRTELSSIGSSTKAIEVKSSLAEEVIFVDYDTDKDGAGDTDDRDDDGDGILDTTEIKNGTDPLVFNEKIEEPDEDEETSGSEEDDKEVESGSSVNNASGLEQYLAPSRAGETLAGFTDFVNTTKQNLDTYRERRETARKEEVQQEEVAVNADGFGEITRTHAGEEKNASSSAATRGFFDVVFGIIGNIFNIIYTAILYGLSLFLAHPAFVQLSILLLILFGLYKLARKFGDRPKK